MDALSGLDVEEMIVIVGHLKEEIQKYIVGNYPVRARFVEQKTLDGTAGAINLARPYVDGPVLIAFVDTLFEADLSLARTTDADGILWAKEVEDYQRFGVIVTDGRGYMTKIVEKPATPISKLANIGLYYVRDWRTLFDGIAHVLAQPPNKGEFYLTDAFQFMVEQGRRLLTARVTGWYDCGKVDTLLETNRHLLQRGRALPPAAAAARGCTIVPPVRIEPGVTLRSDRGAQRDDRGGQHDRGQHRREQHPGPERPGDAGSGARLPGRGRPGDRGPRGGGERDGRRRHRAGAVGAPLRRTLERLGHG